MAGPLYANFLDDPEVYSECQRFWVRTLGIAVRSNGQEISDWPRWEEDAFDDSGVLLYPGNPILDGYNRSLGRAFRIVQTSVDPSAPQADDEMAVYFRTFPSDVADFPEASLVFSLSLTDVTSTVVAVLMSRWSDPAEDISSMEPMIAHLAR